MDHEYLLKVTEDLHSVFDNVLVIVSHGDQNDDSVERAFFAFRGGYYAAKGLASEFIATSVTTIMGDGTDGKI